MIVQPPYELRPLIRRCVDGLVLSCEEMELAVAAMTNGTTSPAQTAALLIALSLRGESLTEVLGAARALRARAVSFRASRACALDVCGTGGDKSGTFNISTAVAFVVAGANVTVAKHGNRAVSGRCGSADAMAALGVRIDASPCLSVDALDEHGIAFLFAQAYHPALRCLAELRRDIGVRTLFNLLGPLINPARPRRQLVGVADARTMVTVARALAALGAEQAAVVHAEDGMDEVSLCGPTRVVAWTGSVMREFAILPEALGMERVSRESLSGGDAAENARLIRSVLEGARGPHRDVVLLNAALALALASDGLELRAGLQRARASIDSGAALAKLHALVEVTNR
ncbi:MAG TPA: anthranilate phosphoribosyltransferase [Candidatus Acidoferrales bacterium]|nr:anthranilate phosphoribosyltransferase [Candidatus Acidoferrales bacterium]